MLSKKLGVLLRVVVGIEPTPCAIIGGGVYPRIGGGVYPRCKLTLLGVAAAAAALASCAMVSGGSAAKLGLVVFKLVKPLLVCSPART
jgi:hypothetical protein